MPKVKELREMTKAEVEQKLKEESQNLFNLKLRHATQGIPKPSELKKSRRQVALIKTVLSEDRLGKKKLAPGNKSA
jgi:large subunit ribosomal protein L29